MTRSAASSNLFRGRAAIALPLVLTVLLLGACRAPEPEPEPLPAPPEPAPKNYARQLEPGENALMRVALPDYPDFESGYQSRGALLEAVDESLAYMAKPSAKTHFPVEGISHARARNSIEAFRDVLVRSSSAREFTQRIKDEFDVYMSVGCDKVGTVLFTGYHEPVVSASRTRTSTFRYPLYRLPDDLVKEADGKVLGRRTASGTIVPYYTRKEIETTGCLEGRNIELAWLKDPFDVYVIHVQGSASLYLPDGSLMKIGYAGNNGKEYGRLSQSLIRDNKMKASEVSLEGIRRYFAAHPDEIARYTQENERYIFFTENQGGPYGSLNTEVTPYHTIATDKSIFPRASVTFIDTLLPKRSGSGRISYGPYAGFALDQDTGSAIRSPGRVDVFLGTGAEAEALAGRTRHEGKLYYLFVRERFLD